MEIKIIVELKGLEVIANAINNLAGVTKVVKNITSQEKGINQQTTSEQDFRQSMKTTARQDFGQPMQNTQTIIPTTYTAQEYTQEQIAKAMTQLVDRYGIAKVQEIMNNFGVKALTELPKEKYTNLAIILREMGASI